MAVLYKAPIEREFCLVELFSSQKWPFSCLVRCNYSRQRKIEILAVIHITNISLEKRQFHDAAS